MRSVPAGLCRDLPRLEHLDLSSNLLEAIPEAVTDPEAARALVTLDLRSNAIRTLPTAGRWLTGRALVTVFLYGNGASPSGAWEAFSHPPFDFTTPIAFLEIGRVSSPSSAVRRDKAGLAGTTGLLPGWDPYAPHDAHSLAAAVDGVSSHVRGILDAARRLPSSADERVLLERLGVAVQPAAALLHADDLRASAVAATSTASTFFSQSRQTTDDGAGVVDVLRRSLNDRDAYIARLEQDVASYRHHAQAARSGAASTLGPSSVYAEGPSLIESIQADMITTLQVCLVSMGGGGFLVWFFLLEVRYAHMLMLLRGKGGKTCW